MPTPASTGRQPDQPASLHVPEADQWITTTKGRIATDGYSWMQAVHWAYKYTDFTTHCSHGPQSISETTLLIAWQLSQLDPCRPGIDYLIRKTRLSERSIQYHLGLLREVGLLVYRTKGTRVAERGGQASEFALTIPPAFDEDVHARTGPSERHIRTLRGIDPAGLPLMKRLARMARRPVRRPGNRASARPASAPQACTPMQVGSATSSPTGTSHLPSESKLASGKPSSPAPKKSPTAKRKRSLNTVGRRYQLAHELITQIPWLARANTQRIAWIVRHVADAGWTAAEVISVISQEDPAQRVHRPSGFLAARLRSATELYNTPERRARIVAWWRDSRRAEQARHTEWDGQWQAPTSRAVARQVNAAFSQLTHPAPADSDDRTYSVGADGLVDLQQLTPDEIIDLRAAAQKDPLLIRTTITACGETYARRLFSNRLVDQLQRLTGTGRLILHGGLA